MHKSFGRMQGRYRCPPTDDSTEAQNGVKWATPISDVAGLFDAKSRPTSIRTW
jgi:hypothetical protein